LTTSNFLIGLVAPIRNGGWFLPQLLASNYLQNRERKLPLYSAASVVRAFLWALMTLLLFLNDDPHLLLVGFFALFTLSTLVAGLSGLSFMDVVGKVIPATRRGSFFGWRRFLGGILALGGSLLVRHILDENHGLPFPDNYGVLFLLYFLIAGFGMWLFCQVVEPVEPVQKNNVTPLGQFRQAWEVLRHDANYRTFLVVRLSLVAADVATPFYIVYAKRTFGLQASMVGVYLVAYTMMGLLSNLFWGYVSDRYGNRLVVCFLSLVGLLTPLMALVTLPLVRLVSGPIILASYSFVVVFGLSGAFFSGNFIGAMTFLLDIAPPSRRTLYVGFMNTALGIFTFSSAVGGLVVDWVGLRAFFYLAIAFYAVALFFSLRLREPRTTGKEAGDA
jgi:MFS family permease